MLGIDNSFCYLYGTKQNDIDIKTLNCKSVGGYMSKVLIVFSILTGVFGLTGFLQVLPYYIALPIMHIFLGATFLVRRKSVMVKVS